METKYYEAYEIDDEPSEDESAKRFYYFLIDPFKSISSIFKFTIEAPITRQLVYLQSREN
jgi:hypothetical protein